MGMMDEHPGQYIDSESPFCRNCDRERCSNIWQGCPEWQDYFRKNWNENIRAKNSKAQTRQFFQYEHPDLVREGIVFRHEQGEDVRPFQAGEAEIHPVQTGEGGSFAGGRTV